MNYVKKIKESYDEVYARGWGNRYPDTDLISIFNRIMKPQLVRKEKYRILDFGCSLGANIKFFDEIRTEDGFEVFGIDISEEAIRQCVTINGFEQNHFRSLDVLAEPIALKDIFQCKFDIILAMNVLLHFSNSGQKKLLENFEDSLESNGLFVAEMPSYNRNEYRMIKPDECIDGLARVSEIGTLDEGMYVNLVSGKEDVLDRFQMFQCINIIKKVIDMDGENESYYYVGKKQER